jgi:hypothetical protein
MISLLFSPLGRYIAIGGVILVALFGVYLKIRSDAVAGIEAAATADAMRRTQDALRAGDSINLAPDKLREPDRNTRD